MILLLHLLLLQLSLLLFKWLKEEDFPQVNNVAKVKHFYNLN